MCNFSEGAINHYIFLANVADGYLWGKMWQAITLDLYNAPMGVNAEKSI